MNQDDKAKSIEKANSYRLMMSSWAWKDFEINILNQKRLDALEAGINAPSMEMVQVERGKVKCVDSIHADLGFIMSDVGG